MTNQEMFDICRCREEKCRGCVCEEQCKKFMNKYGVRPKQFQEDEQEATAYLSRVCDQYNYKTLYPLTRYHVAGLISRIISEELIVLK